MTKKELSQLRHLKYEVRELMDRIKELESSATGCAARIDDLPKSRELTDKVGNYAIQIAELKKELDAKLYQLYREYVKRKRQPNASNPGFAVHQGLHLAKNSIYNRRAR